MSLITMYTSMIWNNIITFKSAKSYRNTQLHMFNVGAVLVLLSFPMLKAHLK